MPQSSRLGAWKQGQLNRAAFAGALLFGLAPSVLAQSRGAVLSGSVVADSTRVPLAGVEVAVPGPSKRTLTTDAGRFRLDSIPAGTHEVIVRQVGFSPQVMHVPFAGSDTVEREVLLRRVPTLETVTVQAAGGIQSFEENRAVGLGTFITRAELEKQEGRRLSDIVTPVRGVRVRHGTGGRAWLYSSRRPVTSIMPSGTKGSPTEFYREQSGSGEVYGLCYAQVYMDERPMYRGQPTEQLFDINSIAPSQIEAIEYYSGPASTPMRYSRQNSNCGVIVIHTRRTPGSSKP